MLLGEGPSPRRPSGDVPDVEEQGRAPDDELDELIMNLPNESHGEILVATDRVCWDMLWEKARPSKPLGICSARRPCICFVMRHLNLVVAYTSGSWLGCS